MATSLVAELAEKLSSATNNLDFDEQTLFLNTSADKIQFLDNVNADINTSLNSKQNTINDDDLTDFKN